MKKYKVYVAGALTDTTSQYIKNLKKMCDWADKVSDAGFPVYVPGWDFMQALVSGKWTTQRLFNNSLPWMECADALFVVPGHEKSKGTKKEILHAKALKIPVFFKVDALIKHYERLFSNPLTTKECYKK